MILLLLFLIVQVSAYAQQAPGSIQEIPEPEHIRALLQSSDPKDQAWGAWYAGKSRFRGSVPLLKQVIEQHVHGKGWDNLDHSGRVINTDAPPMDAALDALIQLEAIVPPDLISAIYEKRYAAAFVLLSKLDQEGDSILLDLAAHEQGRKAWHAAANLLLAHRAPGTAFLLLHDIEIEAVIEIEDRRPPFTGNGEGASIADGPSPVRALTGYPPLAQYDLQYKAGNGNVVFAPGPVPIYYSRMVTEGEYIPSPTQCRIYHEGWETPPKTGEWLQYIAALGHFENKMPISAREHRKVKWHGQSALESEINNFRKDILRRYSKLAKKLGDAGLLTKKEASDLPSLKIKMHVQDNRLK